MLACLNQSFFDKIRKVINTGISLKQEWKEGYFIKKQKHGINVSLLLSMKFEYDSQYLYPRIFLEIKKGRLKETEKCTNQ